MSSTTTNGTAAYLGILLGLGATPGEAAGVCNRFAGTIVPTGPQAVLDQAQLLLEEYRSEQAEAQHATDS